MGFKSRRAPTRAAHGNDTTQTSGIAIEEHDRIQRLHEILDQIPLVALHRVGRAAGESRRFRRKDELVVALSRLPAPSLAEALADALTRRDLQVLYRRLGYTAPVTARRAALATRLVTSVDDPSVRLELERWLPFEQARAFARSLGLGSNEQWRDLARGGRIAADMPRNPEHAYRHTGWTSWGDFLGTGNIAPQYASYRPFSEARAYARSLRLKSGAEWTAFCTRKVANRRLKPPDIPTAVDYVYAGKGWRGWRDFLGGPGPGFRRGNGFRSYDEASKFVHSLGIRSHSHWLAYRRGDLPHLPPCPPDIPSSPWAVYRDRGWVGWAGFLGHRRKPWPSFQAASAYMQRQGVRTRRQWLAWCAGGKRPPDIPSAPEQVYRDEWKGWRDFLGAPPPPSTRGARFRSYDEASRFVQELGIRSGADWLAYRRGELPHLPRCPPDMPACPHVVYRDRGWVGWRGFLGTSSVSGPRRRPWRSFQAARAYMGSQGVRTRREWSAWCAAGKRPPDIPSDPNRVYRDEWKSWPDFLDARRGDRFRSYGEASSFVQGLGIRSAAQWWAYHRGEFPHLPPCPPDMPSRPHTVYRDRGWVSWGRFLGTGSFVGRPRKLWRSFRAARAYLRRQGLRTHVAWLAWCAAGNRPSDIPSAPHLVYRDKWKGWPDFLGADRSRKKRGESPGSATGRSNGQLAQQP